MIAGKGLTVSTIVARQPPTVYVMVGAVPPDAIPVTIPVADPTVALDMSLLVHAPPAGVEFNVVVAPAQTVGLPLIGVGEAFTVTVAVREQVVAKV